MVSHAPRSPAENGGFVVRRPRASDAVGKSLRDVFHADQRMPADLSSIIDQLDKLH